MKKVLMAITVAVVLVALVVGFTGTVLAVGPPGGMPPQAPDSAPQDVPNAALAWGIPTASAAAGFDVPVGTNPGPP